MSKIYFNEYQRQLLEANPNVASVSDRAIQYTPEFKIKAVRLWNNSSNVSTKLI